MEGVVLFGVEHFEQRRCRVALEVVAYLVDFVEDEDRVRRPRFLYALNDAAGHGSDVGAAVSAYLGLVVQTTQ